VGQLLGNARYALATGGRLDVTLKHERISGEEVERLGMNTEEVAVLTVHDTGFGMSGSVARRAFDPFYTTRTQIKAAGLGLTVVHSIAQFHGGQVELQSTEEKGTTVTVWIPANGLGAQMFHGGGRSSAGYAERKKVLLIEDDPLVKEVLRDWLGRMNLDVHIVSSAEEVDAFFTRRMGELSLVITETDLKAGKGEDIHARFANVQMRAVVPWIFLAGRRRPEFPDGMPDGGASPLVMQKPVTLRALAEVVRRHAFT
jgi:CheY-like chemotaxis protein